MLLKVGDPGMGRVRVKDAHGKTIPFVQSFDTETREVTIVVQTASHDGKPAFAVGGGKVLMATFVAPGAYAEDEHGHRIRDPQA